MTEAPPAAALARAADDHRHIGLAGATLIGVGAIVGGGILALAGIAYATTGAGAVLAFLFNGLIALLTALAFAELAAQFPESGGTYTFAKKVLSVRAAFAVGWVVWFASIVAAVLYALGFAAFAAVALRASAEQLFGATPAWLSERPLALALALGATLYYTLGLRRQAGASGQFATVGKVVVFVVLILGGLWALRGETLVDLGGDLQPLLPAGGLGLIQAMGYTFIALQGFDLIAAVGGEVRAPARTIPRAMLLSLVIALVIYMPLLLLIATVGTPAGQTVQALAAADPDTVVATAVAHYLGTPGYVLVLVAAILSMLSALAANLLAAAHVARAMARDRTLPDDWSDLSDRGTPAAALTVTALTVGGLIVIVPDLAAAGAVSSLIFLLSFALAHAIGYLARRRRDRATTLAFRVPLFPLVPLVGGTACLALAVFQAVVVPSAGAIAGVWLAIGGGLYAGLFARRAEVVDALAEARDPHLARLRGRRPLVLVPIARPASAVGLAAVANAMATPGVGRVLMLSVVQPQAGRNLSDVSRVLRDVQAILGETLATAFADRSRPETLITIADQPWEEIGRVAQLHRCEKLLVGLGRLYDDDGGTSKVLEPLERLLSSVESDTVVLRAPQGWHPSRVQRVLVPVGGRRDHSHLRARILASLCREGCAVITFFGAVEAAADEHALALLHAELDELAQDEVGRGPDGGRATHAAIEVARVEGAIADAIVERAQASDLVVLGLRRISKRRTALGPLALRVARETQCPLLLIGRQVT